MSSEEGEQDGLWTIVIFGSDVAPLSVMDTSWSHEEVTSHYDNPLISVPFCLNKPSIQHGIIKFAERVIAPPDNLPFPLPFGWTHEAEETASFYQVCITANFHKLTSSDVGLNRTERLTVRKIGL
jgi:hypothetical protein